MISKSLSKEAKQDFDIVVQVAQSIGLGDHPPLFIMQPEMQPNTMRHRRKKRKVNYSDLLPIQRNQRGREVRERGHSQQTTKKEEHKSQRKGSVKDVFMERVKAYEDPQQFIQTQKALLNKDLLRAQKQARDAKRVQQLSKNKKQRLNILGDISEGIVPSDWLTPRKPSTAPTKYFGERKTGRPTARSISYEKLALSLNFSKFQLVPRRDGLKLLSRERQQRKPQTARSGSRRVQMCFGSNDRPQLIYPINDNQSDLF